MISSFVRALVSAFKARRELALENVDLRQQLAVLLCLLFIHPRLLASFTVALCSAINRSGVDCTF